MRTLSSILVATLLGLSATAFAAEPATREARRAEATKNYEAQKATTKATIKATPAPAASKATVAKRPHAKKHAVKKYAAKKQAKAATGASAPVSVKAAPAAVK